MTSVGIVTGAASGMGRACAQQLVDAVDVLVLVDRNELALSSATDGISGLGRRSRVKSLVADVTDSGSLAELRSLVADLGTLRAVAHAAGISPVMADWRDVLSVDLVGTALLIDALRPAVRAGTAVVCFASIGADLGTGEMMPDAQSALDQPLAPDFLSHIHSSLGTAIEDAATAYCWAKLGVRRLVRREAIGFGRVGARINSVSPGMIDTPMTRLETASAGVDHILIDETPLAREGQADEVAAAATFLISDQASFINGTDLTVDGGLVAALLSGPTPT